ncbi:MAG: phosphatidylinositol mannoside acyltransferase [Acidimicrobiia bacterium]
MRGLPGYLLYRALSGLFGLLPAPARRGGGRWIGFWLSFVARKRMRLLRRHMRRVMGPAPSEDQITAAGREMFASYGRYWAEVFWFRPRRKGWVIRNAHATGLDAVYAAQQAGRGVVLVAPHMGNWEVAGAVAESLNLRVLSVAEDLPNRRITDWFIQTRAAFGIDILVHGRGSTMTALTKALERGQVVALVADRDVNGRGVPVEFFGEMTTMPAGPYSLVELTGAALFPVGSYYDGPGYLFEVHPELPLPNADDRAERIRLGTQALAYEFEDIIRAQPTSWHLFQPNWPSDIQLEEESE